MKLTLATLFAAILCATATAAQVHAAGVPIPLTASTGSDTAYVIPAGTVRLTIHPRTNVYMRTVSGGGVFYIASGTNVVLKSDGLSNKTLYFEAVSSGGSVEFLVEPL